MPKAAGQQCIFGDSDREKSILWGVIQWGAKTAPESFSMGLCEGEGEGRKLFAAINSQECTSANSPAGDDNVKTCNIVAHEKSSVVSLTTHHMSKSAEMQIQMKIQDTNADDQQSGQALCYTCSFADDTIHCKKAETCPDIQ